MIRHAIYTVVDITKTDVRNKTNAENWNLQRNQQRNLETLIQALSLRAQPIDINVSVTEMLTDRTGFGRDLKAQLPDTVRVWKMTFDVEHDGVFGLEHELFYQDIHQVPILNGLTETQPLFPPIWIGTGNLKNISIISP